MSRTCEHCGKSVQFGNKIARRGMAKYLGGVGIKTTGVTRRKFKPNVQRIRIQDKDGRVRRARICTKCLRSGGFRKPMRRDIPEGLLNRMRAKEEAKLPEARKRAAAARAERRRKRREAAAAK